MGWDGMGKDPVSSLRSETPAGGFSGKPAGAYVVLKAIAEQLTRRGIPGPDEKLKRIVGAQISALLRGGYDPERIRHFAIELALSWDNARGHQRLLGLRQAVLQDAADREYAEHERRRRDDAAPVADPAVARAMIGAAKRRLEGRDSVAWGARCAQRGCPRTAIYATDACVDHTR